MNLTSDSLNRWLEKQLAQVSPERRRRLEEFVRDMRLANYSFWTIKANVLAVLSLGQDGKPYEELGKEDIARWLESISHLRPESVSSYRRRVKHFLRWLHRVPPDGDPPEVVRMIKVRKSQRELPRDILTPEEVQRLIAACESLRNRALVHVAYESGCRAGEVLGLRIGDVELDRLGAVIIVSGKTGTRRIRLIESVPDLQRWLAVHPERNSPDAWLWPSRRGGCLSVEFFNYVLKSAAVKARINKRIHPHLLRHTRATHLAKVFTEDQLRVYFGWTRNSHIPARYVHLSGRDVDGTLARHYGLSSGDGGTPCPRCGFINHGGGLYCSRCSAVLSEAEAFRVEELEAKKEELVRKVVEKLIEKAPDLLERILIETGAAEEMASLTEGHQSGAGGGI